MAFIYPVPLTEYVYKKIFHLAKSYKSKSAGLPCSPTPFVIKLLIADNAVYLLKKKAFNCVYFVKFPLNHAKKVKSS